VNVKVISKMTTLTQPKKGTTAPEGASRKIVLAGSSAFNNNPYMV
jgi:hypothetical protein